MDRKTNPQDAAKLSTALAGTRQEIEMIRAAAAAERRPLSNYATVATLEKARAHPVNAETRGLGVSTATFEDHAAAASWALDLLRDHTHLAVTTDLDEAEAFARFKKAVHFLQHLAARTQQQVMDGPDLGGAAL